MYCASGRHKDTEQRVSFDEIICYPLWSFLVATQTKNFLSFIFRFTAEGWGEEARKENARKFLGLPARVRERGRGASPRNRGVRFRFKPPRAPRVRSGFEQSLISHRKTKKWRIRAGFFVSAHCIKKPAAGCRGRFPNDGEVGLVQTESASFV